MKIKIESKDKTMRPLSELHPWDKNPRDVTEAGIERLKEQIKEAGGLFKPLLVEEDGTVLGGNQRLRALTEIGETEAWVEIVHPKNDRERTKLALSSNGRAGKYEENQFAENMTEAAMEERMLNMLHVETGAPVKLDAFLNKTADKIIGNKGGERDQDEDTTKDKLDAYNNSDQRQVVLFLLPKEKGRVEAFFSQRRKESEMNDAEILQEMLMDYAGG